MQHSTVFKARPVNRKVLESAGDLGVPVIRKKAPTVVKEFALTSARSTGSKKVEPSWKRELDHCCWLANRTLDSVAGATSKSSSESTSPLGLFILRRWYSRP